MLGAAEKCKTIHLSIWKSISFALSQPMVSPKGAKINTFPDAKVCRFAFSHRATAPRNCTGPYGFLSHIGFP